MPRPIHSPVRDAFVAALLVVLLLALPGAGSPLSFLTGLLGVGLLLGICFLLLSLEVHRRAKGAAARKLPIA